MVEKSGATAVQLKSVEFAGDDESENRVAN